MRGRASVQPGLKVYPRARPYLSLCVLSLHSHQPIEQAVNFTLWGIHQTRKGRWTMCKPQERDPCPAHPRERA